MRLPRTKMSWFFLGAFAYAVDQRPRADDGEWRRRRGGGLTASGDTA